VPLDEEHTPVGKDCELDGLVQFFREDDFGEPVLFRSCAAEVDRPGTPFPVDNMDAGPSTRK